MDFGVQFNIAGLTGVTGGIDASQDAESVLDALISKASGNSSGKRVASSTRSFAPPAVDRRSLRNVAEYNPVYKYAQDELWSSSIAEGDSILSFCDSKALKPVDVTPAAEVHRHKCVQNLRKRLTTMVDRFGEYFFFLFSFFSFFFFFPFFSFFLPLLLRFFFFECRFFPIFVLFNYNSYIYSPMLLAFPIFCVM